MFAGMCAAELSNRDVAVVVVAAAAVVVVDDDDVLFQLGLLLLTSPLLNPETLPDGKREVAERMYVAAEPARSFAAPSTLLCGCPPPQSRPSHVNATVCTAVSSA
jgi:hypothetical protein